MTGLYGVSYFFTQYMNVKRNILKNSNTKMSWIIVYVFF